MRLQRLPTGEYINSDLSVRIVRHSSPPEYNHHAKRQKRALIVKWHGYIKDEFVFRGNTLREVSFAIEQEVTE